MPLSWRWGLTLSPRGGGSFICIPPISYRCSLWLEIPESQYHSRIVGRRARADVRPDNARRADRRPLHHVTDSADAPIAVLVLVRLEAGVVRIPAKALSADRTLH